MMKLKILVRECEFEVNLSHRISRKMQEAAPNCPTLDHLPTPMKTEIMDVG